MSLPPFGVRSRASATLSPRTGSSGCSANQRRCQAGSPRRTWRRSSKQFTASGFAGGLNWYRNLDRNWEQTAAWQDVPITAPTLYITGESDAMRVVYPLTDAVRAIVPNLRGVVDVPDCGHWTQQERPDLVTAALLDFLRGL